MLVEQSGATFFPSTVLLTTLSGLFWEMASLSTPASMQGPRPITCSASGPRASRRGLRGVVRDHAHEAMPASRHADTRRHWQLLGEAKDFQAAQHHAGLARLATNSSRLRLRHHGPQVHLLASDEHRRSAPIEQVPSVVLVLGPCHREGLALKPEELCAQGQRCLVEGSLLE